jgi:hypothetical protein
MKGLVALHWEPGFAYPAGHYGRHVESLRSGPVEGERGDRASMFGQLDDNADWAMIGFSFSRHTSCPAGTGCWRTSAPVWFICCVLLIVPLYATALASRRRLRTAAGRCPDCGYNLTGNTSGTCPECGTAVKE